MPENGHATANAAVPRWQRNLKEHSCGLLSSTNQQVRMVPKHAELWYSLCVFPHREAFALARIQTSSAFRRETVNSVLHSCGTWFCGDESSARLAVSSAPGPSRLLQ